MKRAMIYVVAAVIVVAGLGAAVRRLREPARGLATDIQLIRGDTGDVMASATYQRFARRREAVASMRAALLQVAAIESMFVADSGRPTTSLFGHYVPKDQHILGPSVEIQRDRWVAKVSHRNATMSCSLTAMVDPRTLDSVTWRYHARQPVCSGWTAESTAMANAPVPVYPDQQAPASVNPAPEPPPPPPQPARAPRQHRDWGPVNNRPPAMPYIVKNACEGEGCARSGTWAACSDVVARRDTRLDAPVVFTIHGGEKFTALTMDLHVEAPGMVVFRHPMSNASESEGNEVDSIDFTPADTLYLLNSHGEGYLVWWFRGQAAEGYQFWRDPTYPEDTAVLVRQPKTIHWVRARNTAGQEGWIVGDFQKMATGGYMDEIERCLPPAKR